MASAHTTTAAAHVARFCPACGTAGGEAGAYCPNDGAALVDDHRGALVAGRFALGELIGVGGMGATVWAAAELPLGRPVAVKIVPPRALEAARRFERGARLMGPMCHPNLPVVHDYGVLPDGSPYLVMERLVGAPLDRVIARGPLDLRRALHVLHQLLSALEHVHAHGVIHRDVKPANLFVVSHGGGAVVKVVDFGIARRTHVVDAEPEAAAAAAPDAVEPPSAPAEGPLTQRDRICGTPEYMAPEQVVGGPIDPRVDLYAAGVTFFRMVTGRLPFSATLRRNVYAAKTRAAAPLLGESAGAPFPQAVESLVARALARDPAARFATARAMRQAVTRILEELPRAS